MSFGFGIVTRLGESSYRIDPDAILILEIFSKKTASTPKSVVTDCRRRLRHFDEHVR
jgi:phage-related protein